MGTAGSGCSCPDDSTGLCELTLLILFLPFPFGLYLLLLGVYSFSLHMSLIQGHEGAGQGPVWGAKPACLHDPA